ncbi:MAG: ribonuclease E inhibitor RraB [Chloroflexi bacterium]|nr:MAG: ribonuclease E inhibitor RraB [Chloroflexota bacterium]TMD53215.1 MAG: ribonuclease E inhibitor RraB [Chloroflexota bacterium]
MGADAGIRCHPCGRGCFAPPLTRHLGPASLSSWRNLSQEQPNPQRPAEGAGRSRRRRRGRGGRGGGGGGGGQGQAAAPATPSARPPSQSGARQGRGSGRGPRRQPAQAAPRPQRELEITDEKIFERLREVGFDLSQEAIVEGYLYFGGEGAARRVAGRLEGEGYLTYVDPSPPGRWVLEAVTRAVPTPERISALGAALKAAAGSGGGIYDGWWAYEPPEEDEAPAPEPEPEPEPAPL